MTSIKSFSLLPPERQRRVHLRLCGEALDVWTVYAAAHLPIVYADSVVGMRHEVDVRLPHDALRSARNQTDLADVQNRYREPIVAMQDGDLEFPDAIEFAYYSIYNCFRRHALGEQIDPWLIVNQALSSIEDGASRSERFRLIIAAAEG